VGNKREEVDTIIPALRLDERGHITTIVEPFCGSCSMSFRISQMYPKKYKFVLNDLDKDLIELIRIAKDPKQWSDFKNIVIMMIELILSADSFDDEKSTYNAFVAGGTTYGHYLGHKYYTFRNGLYPNTSIKEIKDFECPFIDFLRSEDVTITQGDAQACFDKYNVQEAMILLDPPYIMTCNSFYNGGGSDSFNIYEYLFTNSQFNSSVFLIVEHIWIMNVYKIMGAKYITYDKRYRGIRKRDAKHVIIEFNNFNEYSSESMIDDEEYSDEL
jgi:hypothetical protein